MSTATTGAKPSFTAAIDSTPEPHPTSSKLPGGCSCNSSSVSRVVGCAPVPKARPGSTTIASTVGGAASQGGPIQKRPTTTPWWNERQLSSQPSATSSTPVTTNRARSAASPVSSA
jgi:hypothetical protein